MLKAKPKYTFGVTGNRRRKVESGEVEISGRVELNIKNIYNQRPEGYKLQLIGENDFTEDIAVDDTNVYKNEDLIPGRYKVIIKAEEDE